MPTPANVQPTIREIEERFHGQNSPPQPSDKAPAPALEAEYDPLHLARLGDLASQLELRADFLDTAVPRSATTLTERAKSFCKRFLATTFRWLLTRQVEFNKAAVNQVGETINLLDVTARNLDRVVAAFARQGQHLEHLGERLARLEIAQREYSLEADKPAQAPRPVAAGGRVQPSGSLLDFIRRIGPYTRIAVTGPQRSGTTIAAYILARELGYEFIPEEAFCVNDLQYFFRLYESKDRFVIQAPCLCSLAHWLPGCVVLVRRSVEEIIRSQERVGWNFEATELGNYFRDEGPIARVRYEAWDRYQMPRMEHAFELAYDALRGHPLWLAASERSQFHSRQISPAPLAR